jgi:hypothetical protein
MQKKQAKKILLDILKLRERVSEIIRAERKQGVDVSAVKKVEKELFVFLATLGHDVDVNLNVYTQTSLDSRLQAVETLGAAFVN